MMDFETFQARYGLTLDEQQAAAVQALHGPVLLLAVPGSGKTTVLVSRLGFLLENGVAPEQILTMTYTVAATADMRARFASFFGDERAARMEFRTINGVCARIIRDYEQMKGTRAFDLITDEGQLSALVSELYRNVLQEFPTESDIRAMRTKITYVKNQMCTPDEIEEIAKELEGFPQLYHAYQERMKARSRMDYDDQMVYALAILRRYPEILETWQRRYPYLCVDEAQDTSKIQHRIIAMLAGRNGNLFMVGDEDQSIYGFRAAYPKALAQFESDHPGASVLFLERNYRSTPEIVQKADAFIRHNALRREKHMQPVRPSGAAVRRIETDSRIQQYHYLLKVAEACDRETAVLYRDNDCALPLIDLLERRGLPYRTRQLDSSFFTSRIVRDLENMVRFAQDQTDGPRFLEIYYKLNTYLTKQEAQTAVRQCPEDMSILDYLCGAAWMNGYKRGQCKALRTHMEHMLSERASQAVYRLEKYMGYGDYLENRGFGTQKLTILMALALNEDSLLSLLDRLETLRELLKNGGGTPNADFILSTIHSSKGLEYDRVFLLDAVQGVLPAEDAQDDPAVMEEERRLFYVGMTRAKNELCIFAPKGANTAAPFPELVFPECAPKNAKLTFTAPAAIPSVAAAMKEYFPGTRVRHKSFGRGEVRSRRGDSAIIRFADGSEHTLLLSVCIAQGIIKLEP